MRVSLNQRQEARRGQLNFLPFPQPGRVHICEALSSLPFPWVAVACLVKHGFVLAFPSF